MESIVPLNISFDSYDNNIYTHLLYINGSLTVILGGFGVYISWFWAPKIFESYKYFLFNIAIWAFSFDVFFTFFFSPWPLYPAAVNCPTGLLKTKNPILARVWYDIVLFLFGGTTMAILSAFIYRFAILKGKLQIILGPKFLTFLATFYVTYMLPTIVFLHLCAPNSTAVEEAIMKRYPNIIKFFPNKDMACTTLSMDVGSPYNYLFVAFLNIEFSLPIPFILLLIYKTRALLENQKSHMSKKTYLMHKELLKTLIFQLTIPGATLFVPYTIILTLIALNVGNIAIVFETCYVIGTLHSTMNTVMMIYFIKPFRHQFTATFWYKPKQILMEKFKVNNIPLPVGNDRVYSIAQNNSSSTNSSKENPSSSFISALSIRPAESVL